MVHAKGLGINIKDSGLYKDLLVTNGLITVALLENVRLGQPFSSERVLGDVKEACSQGWFGVAGESQQGRGEGDEDEGSDFDHCYVS